MWRNKGVMESKIERLHAKRDITHTLLSQENVEH